MKPIKAFILTMMVGVLFVIGCSQGSFPLSPPPDEITAPVSSDGYNSHSLLRLFTLVANPDENKVDIIPLRDPDFHFNAIRFLEPPANMYLKIVPPIKFTGNILDVNISLTHPFMAAVQYTGFDVCGIIFTHGSYQAFHDPDIIMAGPGDTYLMNADGYTRWWNPVEFPHGKTMFNYIDGLLGQPAASANLNCTLNAYKYYANGLKSNDPLSLLDPKKRGMFGAGQTLVRHYKIDMSGGLVFNYAVDACWHQPLGKPPFTAPDSFPESANRPEAYNIRVTEIYNSLFYVDSTMSAGGNIKLQVDVWDHFNCSMNQVWGESLDSLPYIGMVAPLGGTDAYSTYELDFNGGNLTHNGTGIVLIEVRSEALGYSPVLPDKHISAYFTYLFTIASEPPAYPDGWARTWGGKGADRSNGVAADSYGNLYVTGFFSGTVDFDPSSGQYELTANGSDDIFLSKFNTFGEFQWALAWGAKNSDQSYSIDVDSMDNLYIAAYFTGTVDFDPGTAVEEHAAIGGSDASLSKFDADGNFIWVLTMGSYSSDEGRFVHVDDFDNIYITGYFNNDIDLDPGPGVDMHINNGSSDIFLSKFDPAGNLIWARSWGGTGTDTPYAIAVNSYGAVFTTGGFASTVDFDPGDGTAPHTSNGGTDVFLSQLNANGDFQGALTWGGSGSDYAEGVSLGPSDDVYVAGNFYNNVDFDPGPGVDMHQSNGNMDVFVSKFSSSCLYIWALTWGSTGADDTHAMSIRGGNVFGLGHFVNTIDIDPTDGVDIRTSKGGTDMYLIKLDCFGQYIWARTWGGTGTERPRSLSADSLGNLVLTGGFTSSSIDFDPGPGVDTHHSNGSYDVFLMKLLPDGYW